MAGIYKSTMTRSKKNPDLKNFANVAGDLNKISFVIQF